LRSRLIFGLVLPLAAASALAGCGKQRIAAQPLPYVATTVARTGTIQPSSQLAGIIAPYENVAIQTTLVEPTDDVYVQEGNTVYRGEVLARLDTADLDAELESDLANAAHTYYQGGLSISQGVNALRQAETTLRTDQMNLARDQALLKQGYIATQIYDAQLETVRNDEQTVASDRSNVIANGTLDSSGLQAAAVAQAKAQAQQVRVQIEKATIVSPVNGVVVNRNLNPGEYPGNRQIFTIQQVDPIFAIVHGSGAQIARIQKDAPARVTVSDLGDPEYTGRVVGILNQIVPGSTDFTVKILLQNPERRLRPGMSVEAAVSLPAMRGVLIPETAFTDENHTTILTVDKRHTVHVVNVNEIGDNGVTAVVSGLTSGTRVVSNGLSSVGSGEKVSTK
jgi:multidrug efflux pump subunit AcrA (membrane-fusion protein)